ncbi:MAG: ribulose-phosphate 3-epimerase [Candidatus Atribacteria bacterium]|nr:ribulose-phosphate 3-epimerase [Candidatus Atribacteria bacterium]
MPEVKISASLDCANYLNLLHDIRQLEEGKVDMIHIDIMDGNFVPNFAVGTNLLRALRPLTSLFFDVHLMVQNPEPFIPIFAQLGADSITFHAEVTSRLHHLLSLVKKQGKKVGISLNPSTPPAFLEYLLPYLDMVLLMTVDPGFVGQKFVPEVIPKVGQVRAMMEKQGLDLDIEVDGGIGEKTVPLLKEKGANVFVGGTSSIFSGKEGVKEAALRFRRLCEES